MYLFKFVRDSIIVLLVPKQSDFRSANVPWAHDGLSDDIDLGWVISWRVATDLAVEIGAIRM